MSTPERLLELARKGGWIGVDMDGTLFEYHGWVGWNVIGRPIPAMMSRVRGWLLNDVPVRIVTARVGLPLVSGDPSAARRHQCRVTGEPFSDAEMVAAIQEHCVLHGLPPLPVQCYKDVDMIELWDDRAVQVVANTGRTLAEEHEAEIAALRGKQFQ